MTPQPAASQLPTASALAAASITAQLQAQETLETKPSLSFHNFGITTPSIPPLIQASVPSIAA